MMLVFDGNKISKWVVSAYFQKYGSGLNCLYSAGNVTSKNWEGLDRLVFKNKHTIIDVCRDDDLSGCYEIPANIVQPVTICAWHKIEGLAWTESQLSKLYIQLGGVLLCDGKIVKHESRGLYKASAFDQLRAATRLRNSCRSQIFILAKTV